MFGGIRATGLETFVEQGRKSFNLTCSTGTWLIPFIVCFICIQFVTLVYFPVFFLMRYFLWTDTVLTKGVIIAVVKRGYTLGPILNVQRYNLCDLITCPVAPGSFVITFRKLYPVGIKVSFSLHFILVVFKIALHDLVSKKLFVIWWIFNKTVRLHHNEFAQ